MEGNEKGKAPLQRQKKTAMVALQKPLNDDNPKKRPAQEIINTIWGKDDDDVDPLQNLLQDKVNKNKTNSSEVEHKNTIKKINTGPPKKKKPQVSQDTPAHFSNQSIANSERDNDHHTSINNNYNEDANNHYDDDGMDEEEQTDEWINQTTDKDTIEGNEQYPDNDESETNQEEDSGNGESFVNTKQPPAEEETEQQSSDSVSTKTYESFEDQSQESTDEAMETADELQEDNPSDDGSITDMEARDEALFNKRANQKDLERANNDHQQPEESNNHEQAMSPSVATEVMLQCDPQINNIYHPLNGILEEQEAANSNMEMDEGQNNDSTDDNEDEVDCKPASVNNHYTTKASRNRRNKTTTDSHENHNKTIVNNNNNSTTPESRRTNKSTMPPNKVWVTHYKARTKKRLMIELNELITRMMNRDGSLVIQSTDKTTTVEIDDSDNLPREIEEFEKLFQVETMKSKENEVGHQAFFAIKSNEPFSTTRNAHIEYTKRNNISIKNNKYNKQLPSTVGWFTGLKIAATNRKHFKKQLEEAISQQTDQVPDFNIFKERLSNHPSNQKAVVLKVECGRDDAESLKKLLCALRSEIKEKTGGGRFTPRLTASELKSVNIDPNSQKQKIIKEQQKKMRAQKMFLIEGISKEQMDEPYQVGDEENNQTLREYLMGKEGVLTINPTNRTESHGQWFVTYDKDANTQQDFAMSILPKVKPRYDTSNVKEFPNLPALVDHPRNTKAVDKLIALVAAEIGNDEKVAPNKTRTPRPSWDQAPTNAPKRDWAGVARGPRPNMKQTAPTRTIETTVASKGRQHATQTSAPMYSIAETTTYAEQSQRLQQQSTETNQKSTDQEKKIVEMQRQMGAMQNEMAEMKRQMEANQASKLEANQAKMDSKLEANQARTDTALKHIMASLAALHSHNNHQNLPPSIKQDERASTPTKTASVHADDEEQDSLDTVMDTGR